MVWFQVIDSCFQLKRRETSFWNLIKLCLLRGHITAVFSDVPRAFLFMLYFVTSKQHTHSIWLYCTCLQLSGRIVLLLNQWPIQFHAPCWHLTNRARKVNRIPYVHTACTVADCITMLLSRKTKLKRENPPPAKPYISTFSHKTHWMGVH